MAGRGTPRILPLLAGLFLALVITAPLAASHDSSLVPPSTHGFASSAGFWNAVEGFSAKSGYRLVFFWDADQPIAARVEWGYSPGVLSRIATPIGDALDTAGVALIDIDRSDVVSNPTVYFRVKDLATGQTSPTRSFASGNAWTSNVMDGVYEIDALFQVDAPASPDAVPYDQGLWDFAAGVDILAERVWDATDGYARIGTVLITDTQLNYPVNIPFGNPVGGGVCGPSQTQQGATVQNTMADFVVETAVPFDSHTYGLTPPAIDHACTPFYVGRVGQLIASPWASDLHIGAVLAHEFGHYAFGFDDLYPALSGDTGNCWVGVTGAPNNTLGAYDITIMNNQFGWTGSRWVGSEIDRAATSCNRGTAGKTSWPLFRQSYPGVPERGRNGDDLPDHTDSDYLTPRGNPDGGLLNVFVLDHRGGLSHVDHVVKPTPPPLVSKPGGPYAGQVGSAVTFGASATGGVSPYTFAWDFGDGATSSAATAAHAFDSAGTFTVRLTVTDSESTVRSATTTATISQPPPPTTPLSLANVTHEDVTRDSATIVFDVAGSGPLESRVHYGQTVDLPLSSTAVAGDGRKQVGLANLVQGSTYYYKVRSQNTQTGEAAESTTLQFATPADPAPSSSPAPSSGGSGSPPPPPPSNGAPVAAFSFVMNDWTLEADAGTSSDPDGDALSFEWTFGDGSAGQGPRANHAYAGAGSYNVRLTVRDPEGAQSSTSRAVTAAAPQGPQARLVATATDVLVGATVSFDATGSVAPGSAIQSYEWDFDDGVWWRAGTARASHTFTEAGSFAVRVRVLDAAGRSDEAGILVEVASTPGAGDPDLHPNSGVGANTNGRSSGKSPATGVLAALVGVLVVVGVRRRERA